MKPPPEGWNLERPRAVRGLALDILMWSILIALIAGAVYVAYRVTEHVHG